MKCFLASQEFQWVFKISVRSGLFWGVFKFFFCLLSFDFVWRRTCEPMTVTRALFILFYFFYFLFFFKRHSNCHSEISHLIALTSPDTTRQGLLTRPCVTTLHNSSLANGYNPSTCIKPPRNPNRSRNKPDRHLATAAHCFSVLSVTRGSTTGRPLISQVQDEATFRADEIRIKKKTNGILLSSFRSGEL